jgi:mannose-6-phosphate isomerase
VLEAAKDFPMTGKTFHALFIAEGSGTVSWAGGEEKLSAGQSWLIPASLGNYTVRPDSCSLTLLSVTIP